MNKVKFVLLSAGILLALAFTFGCSSDDGGGNSSGGSEQSYNYCITADGCLPGPFTASTCNGQLSNGCPNSGDLCAGFVDGTPRMHYGRSKAQFCDSRDGKKYVYVEIGKQTWMAENLNYAADGSKCNDNIESNCTIYGRLYEWPMAMVLPSDCNHSSCASQIETNHKGICPSGWHIPSDSEVNELYRYAEGFYSLMANSYWNGNNFPDTYGFSALPGGFYSGGYFQNNRNYGAWWEASELDNGQKAYARINETGVQGCGGDSCFLSVRCVQD